MTKLHSRFSVLWLALALLLALPVVSLSQTFRGGISGTVTDQSGAVVPGAQVTALDPATNATLKSVTSSAGEFSFTDLPIGSYTITVSANGFKVIKVDKVPVSAGSTYALPVKLAVASAGETVEVTAASLAIDTVTDTQTTTLPEVAVQNIPNSGRDFTQMLAQTTGFSGYSTGGGAGNGAVNGSRSNNVNWQIEGTDNNDLWWNIPAVNQGGVSAIAGVILPIDSIENFSFVTSGTVELGRNSGGTANLTIKAGTNKLHGSGYYYNHNELFQKENPLSLSKTKTRDDHYGYSVGGPIWRDRTFFFLGGEYEHFLIGANSRGTTPTPAYQAEALQLLDYYGIPETPVAVNLLNGTGSYGGLWPTTALSGSAINGNDPGPSNYTATGNLQGHSYNGIVHLDENLTDKDHLSATWFIGQGTQVAPTSSQIYYYFENAPIHVQNYSLVYNRVISTSISNQLSAGVSYFNQAFSDAYTNFDLTALGLNTGVTSPTLAGAPHLTIGPSTASTGLTASGSGFDPTGVTAPSGRNDITGHLDDLLAWTKGAHQFKFGGEFRQAQVDDFYQTGQRGTIYFDGSQGPWGPTGGSSTCDALSSGTHGTQPTVSDGNVYYLADFLAGCFNPTASSIVLGDPKRQVFVNTFSLYASDAWQLTKRLSFNYGLRYDYEGPVHSGAHDLSVFDPSLPTGLAVAGVDVADIYHKFWGGFAPRVGFSLQLDQTGKSVLRGGYGFYYDSIYMKSVLQNNGLQNVPVFGPGQNPAGVHLSYQSEGIPGTTMQSGVQIFPNFTPSALPTSGINISTFDPNFRPPYTQSFDLNLQHSFTPNIIWQIGYVGNKATHLMGIFDINAVNVDAGTGQPYASQFPQFAAIDEAKSNLGSNYSSLQTTIRLQSWHGVTSQVGYTWGHALDYETGLLPYLPQDPYNESAEYGNSDYDVRSTLTGYVDYTVPKFAGPERLTKGWEFNSGFSFHGGMPYTVLASSNVSGSGDNADRAVQVLAHPNLVNHSIQSGGVVQWYNPSAFQDPTVGTFSPTRRNQNYNPGYEAVDLSVIKNTKITERVNFQIRADIFNLFNHLNLAPIGEPFTTDSGNGTIGNTIGQFLGNPGIGPGEPLNVVFAGKIQF
jgi:hypothetical protein